MTFRHGIGLARACTFVFGLLLAATASAADRPPNVVVVLLDDMGWRDVGFMGNSFVETPNIDRLAGAGMVFTQAYASAPNCAPTRACLMSGQYTPRHGIYTVVDPRQPPGSPWHKLMGAHSESQLATEVVTLPESLRTRGYATGFFGMWNLGRGRAGPMTPAGQGFDRVVFPETIDFGKDEYLDDDGHVLSDRLTDEVLEFIDDSGDRPFFVYLADHAVHAPFDPEPELLEKYERKLRHGDDRRDDPAHAATVEAVDRNVGRIVAHLAERGLTDETLIVFTSDNGGTQRYVPPLRGGKGELYEGGIRVPLVIAWPGVVPAGGRSETPVASIDLYPTLLELSGAEPPAGQALDGVSLAPLLRGGPAPRRERLFWHFPCYVGKAPPASVVREGDFKLIEFFEDGGHVELYDLADDPHEHHDLATEMPDRAAALTRVLRDWQRDTGALLPDGANPDYDPKASRQRGGERQGAGAGRQGERQREMRNGGREGRGPGRDGQQRGGPDRGGRQDRDRPRPPPG